MKNFWVRSSCKHFKFWLCYKNYSVAFKLVFNLLYFRVRSKIQGTGYWVISGYTPINKLGMEWQTHKWTVVAKYKTVVGTVCHRIVLKHVEWTEKAFWDWWWADSWRIHKNREDGNDSLGGWNGKWNDVKWLRRNGK